MTDCELCGERAATHVSFPESWDVCERCVVHTEYPARARRKGLWPTLWALWRRWEVWVVMTVCFLVLAHRVMELQNMVCALQARVEQIEEEK